MEKVSKWKTTYKIFLVVALPLEPTVQGLWVMHVLLYGLLKKGFFFFNWSHCSGVGIGEGGGGGVCPPHHFFREGAKWVFCPHPTFLTTEKFNDGLSIALY